MASNKVRGVRAALVWSEETARLARLHNNANVLSLGAREYSIDDAVGFAKVFVETAFSGEPRHVRRLEMIAAYEQTGELPAEPGPPQPPADAPGSNAADCDDGSGSREPGGCGLAAEALAPAMPAAGDGRLGPGSRRPGSRGCRLAVLPASALPPPDGCGRPRSRASRACLPGIRTTVGRGICRGRPGAGRVLGWPGLGGTARPGRPARRRRLNPSHGRRLHRRVLAPRRRGPAWPRQPEIFMPAITRVQPRFRHQLLCSC